MSGPKVLDFGRLHCERYVLGSMNVNTYVIYAKKSSDCIVVDPGIKSSVLTEKLKEISPPKISLFLTHGHADHIEGVDSIKENFNCEILISKDDAPMLSSPFLNLSTFIAQPFTTYKPDKLIKENDTISVDNNIGTFLSVRGHTPGGMILVFDKFIISGDTLFAESVGRSDFPGGDGNALIKDINKKILNLSDRTVLPGHGPETTIAYEKEHNQFFTGLSI